MPAPAPYTCQLTAAKRTNCIQYLYACTCAAHHAVASCASQMKGVKGKALTPCTRLACGANIMLQLLSADTTKPSIRLRYCQKDWQYACLGGKGWDTPYTVPTLAGNVACPDIPLVMHSQSPHASLMGMTHWAENTAVATMQG